MQITQTLSVPGLYTCVTRPTTAQQLPQNGQALYTGTQLTRIESHIDWDPQVRIL